MISVSAGDANETIPVAVDLDDVIKFVQLNGFDLALRRFCSIEPHLLYDAALSRGIPLDPQVWTAAEDDIVMSKYKELGSAVLRRLLPKGTLAAIKNRAAKPGVHRPAGSQKQKWTLAEDAMIKRDYPTLGPAGVHRNLPHRHIVSIKQRACVLQIKHNRAGGAS